VKITIKRGLKYRIYPNKEQRILINKTLGCGRFVYNHFLRIRMDEWKYNHKSIFYKDTTTMLKDLKKYPEYSWLKEVDSTALQQSLRDLQKAYDNFFAKRAKFPRFKSKHNHTQSYRSQLTNDNIRVVGNQIQLPKIGRVKTKFSREVVGKISNATVTRTASGKYFVSLCIEYETDLQPSAGGQVGIDVGIKSFYSDSNGNVVENPKFLAKYTKKLIREQRKLSRKKKGSGQWDKQRVRVARVYEKISNTRNDFQHKLSYSLASENSFVAVEKLNIKGMVKNKKLAKAISDAAWGMFFTKLDYKTKERGGELIKIPTFYPSSQTCHVCGFQNPIVKDLSVRDWVCPQCGESLDRDKNAAINILKKALSMKMEVA